MRSYSSHLKLKGNRPLKIAIMGAPSVGKTTLAMQYVTDEVVSPSPTLIEDIFRKELVVKVCDLQNIEKLVEKWNEEKQQSWVRRVSESVISGKEDDLPLTAQLKFSLEITDTAGFLQDPDKEQSKPTFFDRISLSSKHRARYQFEGQKDRLKVPNSKGRHRNSSLASVSSMVRHETCLRCSDGLILMYSVLDSATLDVVRDIRKRFLLIHEEENKGSDRNENVKSSWCCDCLKSKSKGRTQKCPPIFLVGTHVDKRNARMVDENSSRIYDVGFLRHHDGIRKKISRDKNESKSSIVLAHDVYRMISNWPECAGFAEITSRDRNLIHKIFEDLNLSVLANAPASMWNRS